MTETREINWSHLRHAYGPAEDIPALLASIRNFPIEADWKSEPWFTLWSALCHQGEIYSASIAAVPFIVAALSEAPSRATLSFYLLPVSIALADNDKPVNAAAEFRNEFEKSIEELGKVAAASLPIPDRQITKAAQAAILVSKGAYQSAGNLLEDESRS